MWSMLPALEDGQVYSAIRKLTQDGLALGRPIDSSM